MKIAKSLSKSLEEVQKAYWRPFLEKAYDNLESGIDLLDSIEDCIKSDLDEKVKIDIIETLLKDYNDETR